MSKKNVFLIGLDPFNREKLERLPQAGECEFHSALDVSDIRNVGSYDMQALIDKAVEAMEAVEGGPDAIASYWDFPGTLLVAILAERFGLPGPSLTAMFKCEHKYWSRQVQQKAVPHNIPLFRAFDPFDENAYGKLQLMPPFWIKPIKSFRSYLAFQINDERQFHSVMKICQEKQDLMVKPFRELLRKFEMPGEIVEMPETFIAETPISGAQCTLEGYIHEGTVAVYGVIDSVRAPDSSSFTRYEYPSSMPLEIQHRMIDVARLAIQESGLDNCPFNVEFFYDLTTDSVWLLEINPRVSQAHTDMFEKVTGISHLSVMLDLALGRKPKPLELAGQFNVAAHFMLRTTDLGRVKSVPPDDAIDGLCERQPGTQVKLAVKPGQHLSELQGQDMYSYELAQVYIGGRDQAEVLDRYDEALDVLDFEIDKDEETVVV